MTQPGSESQSPWPLANTLPTRPNSSVKDVFIIEKVCVDPYWLGGVVLVRVLPMNQI